MHLTLPKSNCSKRLPISVLLAALPGLFNLAAAEDSADHAAVGATDARLYLERIPHEMRLMIQETGRYPQNDFNHDGWDDLWIHLFGMREDKKADIEIIKANPRGDADHDGISNFEEMLNFSDPWNPDTRKEPPTAAEIKAARQAAFLQAREQDQAQISRFHQLLEEHGVLQRIEGEEVDSKPSTDADVTEKETSYYSGQSSWLAPQLMTCSTTGGPIVLFAERLSSGNFLIAWEGAGDKLYDIEWSDDLIDWNHGGSLLPVVGGIGTWGKLSLAPKRFFRIVQAHDDYDTIPSDPTGGDGTTTFGATITPVLSGGVPTQFLITVNLPSGAHAAGVDLVVNGEIHSQGNRTAVGNVFSAPLYPGYLQQGVHTAQAIVHAVSETTTLAPDPGGILASSLLSFDLGQHQHAVGFRVTESMIAPNDPDYPATTMIAVDIPYDPQGAGHVLIRAENGDVVRQWNWGLDDYPLEFREIWDGTDDNQSQVQPGSYSVELEFGGGIDFDDVLLIAAGTRTWSALCLTENLDRFGANINLNNYYPSWYPHFSSTGSSVPQSAWGPWKPLTSTGRIVDEIRGRIKDVFGLGKTGKWKVRFWQSEWRFSDPIQDPVAAFVSGSNPFNDYDIGIFMGHGVASAGGTVTLSDETVITRLPQHYYPLILNRNTGATHWVGSSSIPKYGQSGNLKWMFLMTCNAFSNQGNHNIYDVCKANNTLPFGDGLRVLCGYTTQIYLESGMGELLSVGLVHKVPNVPLRDGTVVNAWGYVWDESSNRQRGNIARAVFWPECKDDTIYGVDHENIPALQAHASQDDLEENDFTP